MIYRLNETVSLIKSDITRIYGRFSAVIFIKSILINPSASFALRFRIAQFFFKMGGISRIFGLIFWKQTAVRYSCHIHVRAQLGGGIYFPHPVGIVIGEGVVVGDNVTIYQNVTLGRKDPDISLYPSVDDGVTISAGAQILGRVRIGSHSIIGANAVVVKEVGPNSLAIGVPAISRQRRVKEAD